MLNRFQPLRLGPKDPTCTVSCMHPESLMTCKGRAVGESYTQEQPKFLCSKE